MVRKRQPDIEMTELPPVVSKIIRGRAEPLVWEGLMQMRAGFCDWRDIVCSVYMCGFMDGHQAASRVVKQLENTGGDGI